MEPTLPPPDFTVVLRGYDTEEVDALLARARRNQVTAAQVRAASFRVALRGYDREQVDQYCDQIAATLG